MNKTRLVRDVTYYCRKGYTMRFNGRLDNGFRAWMLFSSTGVFVGTYIF